MIYLSLVQVGMSSIYLVGPATFVGSLDEPSMSIRTVCGTWNLVVGRWGIVSLEVAWSSGGVSVHELSSPVYV